MQGRTWHVFGWGRREADEIVWGTWKVWGTEKKKDSQSRCKSLEQEAARIGETHGAAARGRDATMQAGV